MSPSAVARSAAVAGQFYPAAPDTLARAVRSMLQDASAAATAGDTASSVAPKALIVPHAGYVYSGPTAARAYSALAPCSRRLTRIVLIGPAHRVAVRGVAAPTAESFVTPLGSVPVDRAALAALEGSAKIVLSDRAHAFEHALEVQLPFLQCALERFTIVPLLVGEAEPEQVADVLDGLWGGDETLIVVSSDLSHYLPYEDARRTDAASVAQMLALGPDLAEAQACGATPINALLRIAGRRKLMPRLLTACNSGDQAGGRDRVVGYAALAFVRDADTRGETLLALARDAVEGLFRTNGATRSSASAAFLDQPGATFVTLRCAGELRGCIGSLDAERTLREDVVANARAAARRDPRFAPLAERELEALTIEVSLLSARQPIDVTSEDELLRHMAATRTGLTLEYRERRATFLPQVWNEIGDAREFLRLLKAKAGLPADFWSHEVRVAHYTVEKWSEA